jgi:hypothetical protein
LGDNPARNSDVFEAFGMKFPADQITVWGLLIVVSVQLYFFVYLRQLSGKLKTNDPGWDAPWIAMDQSRTSTLVVFLTFVILAPTAIISLARQAVLTLAEQPYATDVFRFFKVLFLLLKSNLWSFAKLFGLSVVLAASIYLGILCWKYRPRVASEEPKVADPAELLIEPPARLSASSCARQALFSITPSVAAGNTTNGSRLPVECSRDAWQPAATQTGKPLV